MICALSQLPLRVWWVLGSALLMAIGAIGPWAKALFVSVSGLDGDGWFVLIAAVVIVAMTLIHLRRHAGRSRRPWWPFAVALVAGVIAAATAIYDANNVQREISNSDLEGVASVGWGLWLDCVASVSAAVAVIAAFLKRNEGAPPVAVPPVDAPADTDPEHASTQTESPV
jgi:drug/metabolite transporter (DMT)-like permease